jgi:hypothetical protein
MWHVVAGLVDFVHALAMVAWVGGLPLLVWRGRPAWSRAYVRYAIAFILLSQGSQWLLGECFLTSLTRAAWQAGGGFHPEDRAWFTIRVAEAVFRMRPTERMVSVAFEALVLVTAIGVLVHGRRRRGRPPRTPPSGGSPAGGSSAACAAGAR